MHLLSSLDAQMESPKIHLQSRCYSRQTQCPAWISYLLLEGVEVGLIGLPTSTSHPDILPLPGARSCDCQYGGWWSREAGRQLEVASVSSSTNSARERKPRGKASRPLKRARCRSHPNHETNTSMGLFFCLQKRMIPLVVNIYSHFCQQTHRSMISKRS